MVRRDKIMAYIARTYPGGDPSTAQRVSQTIHKSYSGYVHGAAPQILDLYRGRPERFHLAGLAGTSRQSDHSRDFLNYPYRALMSAATVAIALDIRPARDDLYEASTKFGTASGLT